MISGVNRGTNVGDDILYSGTVAAATEAVLQGIPAIAVSTVADSGYVSICPLQINRTAHAPTLNKSQVGLNKGSVQ